MLKIRIVPSSANSKTGAIAVTTSDRSTCPVSCPQKGNGCYAEGGNTRLHWDKLTKAEKESGSVKIGVESIVKAINDLPPRIIVRHNEAGDLPHVNGKIDDAAWSAIDAALSGKKRLPFTYTHHKLTDSNIAIMKKSKTVINASCESIQKVKRSIERGLPTVAAVKGLDKMAYKQGVKFVQCPAEYLEGMQCIKCGNGTPLCARRDRDYVIGFNAHGVAKSKVTAIQF